MDEPETDTPSATPTLSPVTRVVAEGSEPDDGEGPGIDAKGKNFMDGASAMWSGLCMVVGWFWNGGRRLLSGTWSLLRADKRNAGLAVMAIALVIVGFIAYDGHNSKAPQPPKPATATQQPPAGNGVRKHTVKKNEHLAGIGKSHGVSRLEMTKANPGINPDKLAIGQVVNVPATTVANNGN